MAVVGNLPVSSDFEDISVAAELDAEFSVLVDARKINDGGIGVYTRNLIAGMLAGGKTRVTALVKPDDNLPPSWQDAVRLIVDQAKPYSLDELWNLAKRIDFSGIDLFHIPHYTLPFKVPVPTVITVHDLIHINYPEKKYYPWIAGPILKSALKRATRIITVSEASRREIERFAGPGAMHKVRVIPNAIDPYYLQKKNLPGQPKSGLCGQYLLGIFSNLKPHKGLKDLLEAFQIIRKKYGDLKLVLAGQGTEGILGHEDLLKMATEIKGVHILGRVGQDELAELYRRASALVVSSYTEGFCLPIIEAQAMGTSVITRPLPAALELVTGNDIVCRDFSVDGLVEGVATFLSENGKGGGKDRRIDLDLHLRRFDQAQLASIVQQIYREALE